MVEGHGIVPWSRRAPKQSWRAVFGIGAGALIATFYIGTADIAIATEMGARFGFSMWWTYFALGLAAWGMMDMSVRYYLRFGRTPLTLFKEAHPALTVYLFATVVVTTILGAYSQWNACSLVLADLFPVLPSELAGALAAGAALCVLALGLYRRVEAFFVVGLIALVLLFALAALAARAPWGSAPSGLLPSVPPPPRDHWFSLIQKNAGSLINAWLILIYPYTMIEKGWYSQRLGEQIRILKRARWDYGVGIAAAGLVALPILAAATAVARPFGIVPEKTMEFAALLEPVSGSAARSLFLGGLFLAAWTAGVGWIVCGAYAMLDMGNLALRMQSKPFRHCLVVFAVASVAILFLRVDPIYGIKIFAGFLAIIFPLVAIVLVWRISRADMGYYRWWPFNARGLVVLCVDLFAVAVSLAVGWGMLTRLF